MTVQHAGFVVNTPALAITNRPAGVLGLQYSVEFWFFVVAIGSGQCSQQRIKGHTVHSRTPTYTWCVCVSIHTLHNDASEEVKAKVVCVCVYMTRLQTVMHPFYFVASQVPWRISPWPCACRKVHDPSAAMRSSSLLFGV